MIQKSNVTKTLNKIQMKTEKIKVKTALFQVVAKAKTQNC